MTKPAPHLRVAADVGGTFTDLVALDGDGRPQRLKEPSTPPDFETGVIGGLARLTHGDLGELSELVHASTVATNAILQRQGPRTGLITTEGFRDILEIGRLRYPRLYDLAWRKPPPLVPRDLRLGVPERIQADGSVLRRLDRRAARRALRRLRAAGVESLAVCLINSYANHVHERAIGELAQEELPGVPVSLSVDVLPVIREFDRTSTTVINAFLRPVVGSYIERLTAALRRVGSRAPLLLLQSGGGVLPAADAARLPAYGVESGPSAGVMASAALARDLGLDRVISFDMGGTTAKAAVVLDGTPAQADEFEVGAGLSAGTRLSRGGGYLLRTPSIDLAEVGAGGGSIARVDASGGLAVGPASAGADPGPACYARGGAEATLTDANVVLGNLSPSALLGGAMPISAAAARKALAAKVARPLRLDLEQAADAVHQVAIATMARAIRAVTSERGLDPREFTLVAFGGAGPGHAAALAAHLGIRRVLIPPSPGLFSATGLLRADLRWTAAQSELVDLADRDAAARLRASLGALTQRAVGMAVAAGHARRSLTLERVVECRYRGQSFEIPVPMPDGRIGRPALTRVREIFETRHEAAYGHREAGSVVQAVTLRVDAIRPQQASALRERPVRARDPGRRNVWFGRRRRRTPVVGRGDARGGLAGPAIIEEYDATTVVPPGWRARLDRFANLVLARLT
jgi:N-methylhydantoinase A